MTAKGVLDLSFLDLSEDSHVKSYLTESLKERELSLGTSISPNKLKKERSEIKAVRLGNNQFTSLDNVSSALALCELDFENIHWLDLSFNQLEKFSIDFAKKFPNLQLLYLQANSFTKLSELKKLAHFKSLKSLVLFGNPVEESKHYRNMILWALPQLQILDFCPLTVQQRERNEVWTQTFRRKLYPDEYLHVNIRREPRHNYGS